MSQEITKQPLGQTVRDYAFEVGSGAGFGGATYALLAGFGAAFSGGVVALGALVGGTDSFSGAVTTVAAHTAVAAFSGAVGSGIAGAVGGGVRAAAGRAEIPRPKAKNLGTAIAFVFGLAAAALPFHSPMDHHEANNNKAPAAAQQLNDDAPEAAEIRIATQGQATEAPRAF